MTNKQFELTQEQKSLIWVTKLQPSKATPEEAQSFYMVADEYGLNPLLGDINFQKYETKYGPRVTYLITRDAYMKHAMRQDDYLNMLSGVVKEGDYFELNVVDGVPIHKFGTKRGGILGSWAVVKTKSRGNTVVFADFQEYHRALSPKNPVWRDMPSAMIEKVAQSMVLKRTFPLGVIFATEDEVGSNFNPEQDVALKQGTEDLNSSVASELEDARKKKEDAKIAKEKATKEKKETVHAKQPVPEVQVIQPKVEKTEPVVVEEQPELSITGQTELIEQGQVTSQPVQPVEKMPLEEVQVESTTVQTPSETSNLLEYVDGFVGESGNGTKYLRVKIVESGKEVEVFARGEEQIALFDEFQSGTKFEAEIQEMNGFRFFISAQAV